MQDVSQLFIIHILFQYYSTIITIIVMIVDREIDLHLASFD